MRKFALIGVLLCGGCVSNYAGPAPESPSAEISFTAVEGEKPHRVTFGLMHESSSDNCFGGSEQLAYANVGMARWASGESENLEGVRIPAEREIEIGLHISYAGFLGGGYEVLHVAFTPIRDREYRLDLEWDRKYLDVRVLETAADGGVHTVPIRLEECRSSLLWYESVPIEPD